MSTIFTQRSWDLSLLPDEYKTLPARLKSTATFSVFHEKNRLYSTMNAAVVSALLELKKAEKSEIAAVCISEGTYIVEQTQPDGSTLLFELAKNGSTFGAIVNVSGRHSAIPPLHSGSPMDVSAFMLALFLKAKETLGCPAAESFMKFDAAYIGHKNDLYLVSDFLYYAAKNPANGLINDFAGGNIPLLTETHLANGLCDGELICGSPKLLNDPARATTGTKGSSTFASVFQNYEMWRKKQKFAWDEEEQKLIPKFPDDYSVQPEVIRIAEAYTRSEKSRRPMQNFMWRGITSYGKSTGVEILAAILGMPLLRVTCHSSMETQDFLSNIVPCNNAPASSAFPTFKEMAFDPEGAYKKLTGNERAGVTSDECLAAYAEAYSASKGGSLFQQVESNFVKALSRGYLLEVQEVSRIKDPGVLVGLNEYDRPGAFIPLVNGTQVQRHPKALVVYTDNVGYVSCRPIDISVIRRMSMVFDSFTIPKNDAITRCIFNTGFKKKTLLAKMYGIYEKIGNYCAEHDISEGSVSQTEFEMWAQMVAQDGYNNLRENCVTCLIAKATNIQSEQQELLALLDVSL